MTLSWSLQEPSPGNTTFTIDVYEATDDTGGTFNKYNSININGMLFFNSLTSMDFSNTIHLLDSKQEFS